MSVPPSSWLVIRRRKYPRTSCWVRVDPPCGKTTAALFSMVVLRPLIVWTSELANLYFASLHDVCV